MALMNFYKRLKSFNRGNVLIIDFLKTQQFKKKIVLLMSILLSVAIYAFFSTQVNSYKEAKEKNFLNFLNSKT